MLNCYDLRIQFKVIIKNTQIIIANVQQLEEDALVWLTDRSKMTAGDDRGVTEPRF